MAEEKAVEKSILEELGVEEEKEEPIEEKIEETKEPEEKEKAEEEIEEEKEGEKEEKEEKEEEVVEKELSKEEIDKLPKDAKGLYFAMKQEWEKRKAIEGELEFLKLQRKYKPAEEKKETSTEEKIEDISEILKDKADDDLLSAGELRRILAAQNKKIEKEKETILSKHKEHEREIERIDEIENVFKETHPDYDGMFDIFKKAAREMPSLQYEIIAETKRENGNPAKKVYELGKKFKPLYGEKSENGNPNKKEEEAKRILKNAEKKKLSASVTGQSVSNEALEEMDVEELGKALSSMSMSEFMKVPKKLRQKALTISI